MSLNSILYLSSFSKNLLTILYRLLYINILIIQFLHSTSVNVRLSYCFSALLLWMLSSVFFHRSWIGLRWALINCLAIVLWKDLHRFFLPALNALLIFICKCYYVCRSGSFSPYSVNWVVVKCFCKSNCS